MEIEFIKPTYQIAMKIAADMRDEDATEVWHLGHYDPLQALMMSIEKSTYSAAVKANDDVIAVLGLNN